MLKALYSTMTELADSKKAAYAFAATIMLAVLIVYFKVDRETALFVVSPLGLGLAGQAHVDAAAARSPKPIEGTVLETYAAEIKPAMPGDVAKPDPG